MLQSPKGGKNTKEKRRYKYNILNNNKLRKSLKIRVFATNFAVGCFHASYERLFVKKIQHLFSFNTTWYQFCKRSFIRVFPCKNILHKCKKRVPFFSEKTAKEVVLSNFICIFAMTAVGRWFFPLTYCRIFFAKW